MDLLVAYLPVLQAAGAPWAVCEQATGAVLDRHATCAECVEEAAWLIIAEKPYGWLAVHGIDERLHERERVTSLTDPTLLARRYQQQSKAARANTTGAFSYPLRSS